MVDPSEAKARSQLSNVFVGREVELEALRTALTDALRGRGRLCLLSGEPGIGKTRLCEELARQAQQGAEVLWGRCWEGEGAPAFWPWVEIVRAVVRDHSWDAVSADLGPAAEDILHLAPELRRGVADAQDLAVPEAAHDRFRLFDSYATLLRRASERRPLLLIVDDLHWADEASLQLLQFLSRDVHDGRVLILGTLRSTETRCVNQLAGLARASACIALRELSASEVGGFVRAATGTAPAADVVERLHRETAGNPFFLRELVSAGFDVSAVPTGRVPLGVRASIRGRVQRLSPACRALLSVASVIGGEFDGSTVRSLLGSDVPGRELFDALDEVAAAGLVNAADAPGRYRFTHALVRETLYDDLPTVERARLHRAVGESLEQRSPAVAAERLAELAHHFVSAAPAHGVEKAIEYSRRAGDHARARLAYESAAAHYAAALRALEHAGQPVESASRGELLIAMGEARRLAGQTDGARAAFLEAVRLARSVADPALLAKAALGLAGGPDVSTRGDAEALALLEEAGRAPQLAQGPLAARLMSKTAVALCFAGERERGVALAEQAVEVADRSADQSTVAFALNARRYSLLGPDYAAEKRRVAERIFELAQTLHSQELTCGGYFWRLMDLLDAGDGTGFDAALERYAQLAELLRQPFLVWRARVLRAMRALLLGRFDDAERYMGEALALGQRAQTPNATLVFAFQLLALRLQQGRLAELEPTLHELDSSYQDIPAMRCGAALLKYHLGRRAEARASVEQLGERGFADLPRDAGWLVALAAASEIVTELHDTGRAAALYHLLLPHARQCIVVAFGDLCHGSVALALGSLATTLSDWDAAQTHFEAALAVHTGLGARPYVAHTERRYAAMLMARDGPGDRRQAHQLLSQAIATYADLGMESFGAQSISLRAAAEPEPTPTTDVREHDPTRADEPSASLFRRRGEYWELGYEGTVVRVRDRKGLHYLVPLLREPGREFHVADLLMIPPAERRLLATGGPGCEDETLPDERARAAYQRRLGELRDEVAAAESFNDPLRAAAAREQIELLAQELSRRYGFAASAGRSRNAAVERMRKRVAKSVQYTLAKVRDSHPPLWRHLCASLRMGTFCSYTPERPTAWITGDP